MIASSIFSFLRQETQRAFGEGSYLFFPATRGATTYTVIVACTAGTNRGQANAMSGLLTMATDSRVFDVAAADVPFEPRPDDIVLYGTALTAGDGTLSQDPDNPPVKFRLTSADKATFHAHWHLAAEKH